MDALKSFSGKFRPTEHDYEKMSGLFDSTGNLDLNLRLFYYIEFVCKIIENVRL